RETHILQTIDLLFVEDRRHYVVAGFSPRLPINPGNKNFTSKLSTLSGQKDSSTKCVIEMEGKSYEKYLDLVSESASGWSCLDVASQTNGGRSVFVGGDLEICVRKSGSWTLHEIGHAISPFDCRLCWLP